MGQAAEIIPQEFTQSDIRNIATVFDIKQILRATCGQYGFKHFLLTYIPHSENEKLDINTIAVTNNWPTEVLGYYDLMGAAENEYVLKLARARLSPFVEDIEISQFSDSHAELMNRYEFQRNGYFPVSDGDGLHLLILTGTRNVQLSEDSLAHIQLFVARLVEKILEIIPNSAVVESNISQREKEVLQWIAEGKTSAEIATIMSLSEHTVNHYAMLAVQKLECVNRTQAVVRAMRLGLIR